MNKYGPICISSNGKIADKVNLKPDFFTGFDPKRRPEIVKEEAAFYHGITKQYSVDDRITKEYIKIPVRDGAEISVKVYRPNKAGTSLPAFVFMHGGGYITCSVETHDFVPSYISANAGCVCFSIEYRLAPEYKFPKGIEDCYDVSNWIIDHSCELGIDSKKVSVGGDSSGGNFAAVLALMAKKNGKFRFAKQILIYPVTDLSGRISKASSKAYAPVGSSDGEKAGPSFLDMYLSPGDDLSNPMISPLLSNDLAGLPPALFILAECDALRDDGLYYAKALKDNNVNVEYCIYKGMPHAFILRTYDETFEALNKICSFMKK